MGMVSACAHAVHDQHNAAMPAHIFMDISRLVRFFPDDAAPRPDYAPAMIHTASPMRRRLNPVRLKAHS